MTSTFLLLGAHGDLTRRFLLPALAHLQRDELLPLDVSVVAVGRRDGDDDAFRQVAAAALQEHAAHLDPVDRAALCSRLRYAVADVGCAAELRPLMQRADGPLIIYLALPHTLFAATITALSEVGLPAGSRLVVEKPFGTDLAGARRLNQLVDALLPEDAVFRVDHFLTMQSVLDLLGLRFANRIFEPIWHAGHVERVDIIWEETLALEDRAGYYDSAGALRDMLQNHLLQLLCLIAMEPPTSLGERDLRDRKAEVLRATHPPTSGQMDERTRRGRYTAGMVDGRALPSYADEPGVDPDRGTETFAEVTLTVDNWRWSGVPFTLRAGKALAQNRREIAITFREVPHLTFGANRPAHPNVLRLSLDPDSIAIEVNVSAAGRPFELAPATLGAQFAPPDLPTYAHLLAAVFAGDPTLSLRGDEAEEAWRVMEPILGAWAAGGAPLQDYPAGSVGPTHKTPTD
ncbi:glucose-6-phosphate dehydrogenase [Dermatophilaceae bacterium Sec6.4]